MAFGLVAIGVAAAAAGIYVGEIDDAPGAALSLASQDSRRLQAHGAQCRYCASDQGDDEEQRAGSHISRGVHGTDAEQQAGHETRRGHRECQADDDPEAHHAYAWPMTSRATSVRLPPRAMRMQISLRCCCT